MEARLDASEQKQTQMIQFLSKALQHPELLQQLVGARQRVSHDGNPASGYSCTTPLRQVVGRLSRQCNTSLVAKSLVLSQFVQHSNAAKIETCESNSFCTMMLSKPFRDLGVIFMDPIKQGSQLRLQKVRVFAVRVAASRGRFP